MRVRGHDEPASAAFGSQTARQSLQRAVLHISVISSGLLTLLPCFPSLFGELEIPIVTSNEEWDCAQCKIDSLMYFPSMPNLVSLSFPCIFNIHAGVTVKFFHCTKTTLSGSVSAFLCISHKHFLDTQGTRHTHKHKASLIEFIGEWMLTRPLQVG